MKKSLLIGLIIAVVLIIVGGAGIVYAHVRGIGNVTAVSINTTQNGDKIIQPFEYGPGDMLSRNEQRYGPGGMMGGNEYGYGPGGMMRGYGESIICGSGKMKDYIISAFASAVGLTVDELNTRLSNGESFKQIAIAQGKAEADLPTLATQVRKDALDKAVADGVITQAQADQMLKRMNNNPGLGIGSGFGLDTCPIWNNDESQQP
jgi:hypothetical protein